jgi:hypothetical protein
MKALVLVPVVALMVMAAGCARSTIETRKQERYGAYAGLAEESRALVDAGNIQIGMPMDAVYIAWGKPSEILEGESPEGRITTWLYYGTHFEEIRYWSYHPYRHYEYCYYEPYLRYDYYPRSYVRAEVSFENGAVKSWQMLPRPTY